MTDPDGLTLPAAIPFADLKARDLEECVYWLFDSMGARDLEWRIGGAGGGTADGGRDIEATFHVPGPDGELEPQRWWIECKGRTGTVEADEVKSAANNSLAQPGLARLVIVTNTQFSNPTSDWVRDWQRAHPRPVVRLWDRTMLERQISRHPGVVLRLFSEALSPSGLMTVVQQRFWERMEHSPRTSLRTLWNEREDVHVDGFDRFALIANEFAHGSIGERPWAASAEPDALLTTVVAAFSNLPWLYQLSQRAGVDMQPLVAALAHLLLVALQFLEGRTLADLLLRQCLESDGEPWPAEAVELLLVPILGRLTGEMQDVCTADCRRVSLSGARTLPDPDRPIDDYWRALDPAGRSVPEDDRQLRIERNDAPCAVGFSVNAQHGCPLFENEPTASNVAELLAILKRVSAFRLALHRTAPDEASPGYARAGGAGQPARPHR